MKNLKKFFVIIIIFILGGAAGWQATTRGWVSDFSIFLFGEEEAGSPLGGAWQAKLPPEYSVDMGLFWAVWHSLEDSYVDESALDRQKMAYGAIKGMAEALGDPYTVFMDPSETEEFTQNIEGEFEGIGAKLEVDDDGNIVVSTPLKDSPAEKAGLLPKDIIYKIDDEYAADLTLFEAIMKIRGEIGTPVTLTILREGAKAPVEITIIRAKIDVESVEKKVLDDGIVYVAVNQFSDDTSVEFSKAIADLVLNEPKGLIVDLRYNGGGYLDIAIDILSQIFESGIPAVSVQRRDLADNETLYTDERGKKLLNTPLVVLVNDGSASASEIVAGAVQDHKRGILMGTQTFGKGSVQEVEMLEDGSSLRFTIAKWLTPNGRLIDHIGITPDIIVENYDDDVKAGIDRQLDEAVKYLKNL
jgi:carboxyl-terminal processing protease